MDKEIDIKPVKHKRNKGFRILIIGLIIFVCGLLGGTYLNWDPKYIRTLLGGAFILMIIAIVLGIILLVIGLALVLYYSKKLP